MMRAKKEPKRMEVFNPYDADKFPDTIPFPALGLIVTTRSEEIPVPKLNKFSEAGFSILAFVTWIFPTCQAMLPLRFMTK